MPLVPVLSRIEANGVCIDADNLRRQSQDLAKRMHQVQNEAHAIAGRSLTLESPKQLQAILFDELGLRAEVKTPTGQPSTHEDAPEATAEAQPLPRRILYFRGLAKRRSAYPDTLPRMLHTQPRPQ